mmetsp:Transcript_7106/g.12904  ORF Transcript_7106/g.12904 Transcript_7106/m.12904 type:complete len:213 (-) Transcript_7106:258-896(-)
MRFGPSRPSGLCSRIVFPTIAITRCSSPCTHTATPWLARASRAAHLSGCQRKLSARKYRLTWSASMLGCRRSSFPCGSLGKGALRSCSSTSTLTSPRANSAVICASQCSHTASSANRTSCISPSGTIPTFSGCPCTSQPASSLVGSASRRSSRCRKKRDSWRLRMSARWARVMATYSKLVSSRHLCPALISLTVSRRHSPPACLLSAFLCLR